MPTTNQKIGNFIAEIRQDRGLTQAQLADRLSTSQSAINRIERGKQNLSLETLGRISDALNHQLLALSDESVTNLRIHGGQQLQGKTTLKASKNAAVALLCASLLNHGVTRFKNFPKIEEVYRIIEVLESIGVNAKWDGSDLELRRPGKLKLDDINDESARKTRSVIMLLGPLMHELANFKIPYAGGCELGKRSVEPHLFALEEFGVNIIATRGNYHVSSKPKAPGELTLSEQGNTVTNNVLMAAALTPSTTKVYGASGDYMTQDLAYFLQKLGVKISGIGTPFLTITGVKKIKRNVTYTPTEDPIEAMFFIASAVVTNSKITIERVPIRWLGLELLKLKQMGLTITRTKPYLAANGQTELADITIEKHGELTALADKLHPNLWPGINPDSLPYMVIIAACCRGRTLIHDWIFENRAIYYTELTKIGANIELADPHRVFVTGPTKWRAADLTTPPALRPASLLIIGMLAADGTSTLRNVYTIRRGYEDLANRLNKLGANIQVLSAID